MWSWDVNSQSSRKTTVESSMKSEHNLYLACEDSSQRAFFFWTSSCSLLGLLASTVATLTSSFLFLNAANRRLRSVLDSAKHVRCGGPGALSYPSSIVKKRRGQIEICIKVPKFPWVTHGKELCKPYLELFMERIYAKHATSYSWRGIMQSVFCINPS